MSRERRRRHIHKSRSNEQTTSDWRPTEQFFLSNPRSREIREHCIIFIQAANELLTNPAIGANSEERQRLRTQMAGTRDLLAKMGIRENMHVNTPWDTWKQSPSTFAEWIAGGIIFLADEQIPNITTVSAIISEHMEPNGIAVLTPESVQSRTLSRFVNIKEFLETAASFLATQLPANY